MLAAGLLVGIAVGYRDPMLQSSFPCQEDEALVFAAKFGPDRVGCVILDDFVSDDVLYYLRYEEGMFETVTEIAPTNAPLELR